MLMIRNKNVFPRVCSICALHTKALCHIRPFFDVQTANATACSASVLRLDYSNSLLAGVTAHNIA